MLPHKGNDFAWLTDMPESFDDILTTTPNGVRLAVRAKPGLSRPRPPKIVDVGDGKRALEITVAAAPEDGKANKAILAALADHLGLKKADLSLRIGSTGRLKHIDIDGDILSLKMKLKTWFQQLD